MHAPPVMGRNSGSSWMSSGSSASSSSRDSHSFTGEFIPQSGIMDSGSNLPNPINIAALQLQGGRN
jgi:hypothetical protein